MDGERIEMVYCLSAGKRFPHWKGAMMVNIGKGAMMVNIGKTISI